MLPHYLCVIRKLKVGGHRRKSEQRAEKLVSSLFFSKAVTARASEQGLGTQEPPKGQSCQILSSLTLNSCTAVFLTLFSQSSTTVCSFGYQACQAMWILGGGKVEGWECY